MNALSIAFDSIWTHRLRSSLTSLGIVIGVFAVVTLMSLGAAVNSYVSGQFSTMGATILTVTSALPGASSNTHLGHKGPGGNGGFGGAAAPNTLTPGDAQAILSQHSSSISRVAPLTTLPETVSVDGKGSSGELASGTNSDYFSIEGLPFAHGRFSSQGVVIGTTAAKLLFGTHSSVVGRTVYVGSSPFKITGELKSATGVTSKEVDNTVYMPIATGMKLAGLNKISTILVEASGNNQVDAANAVTTKVLNQRQPNHDFAIVKNSAMLSTITSTLSTISDFLAGLAAISLLVGGIGIMNIMLVTVTERFREIGIRKALGARNGDILVQFLAESVLLSVFGGAVGIGFSALASNVIGHVAGFPAGLTVNAVAVALIFSIAVGAVFGVLPAIKASALMPAEALRTE